MAAETQMIDGQDASEAAADKDELQKLIEETAGPAESKEPLPNPLELKAARLRELTKPVYLLSAYTKVLLFGKQGTGKTTWSMKAPKPMLLAIEVGQKSLLNFAETNDLPVQEFKSVQQAEDLAMLTKEGYFGEEYETYSLDTFSELEKANLSERVLNEHLSNRFRDRYLPEGKDYQQSGEHMRQIAASYRDVPKNVIFVCQEVFKNGIYQPALPDKVLDKLGEYCDVVARATADWTDFDNPKFTLQTRATPDVLAKSRIKILPTFIEGSDFNLIHRANMKQITDAQSKKG
jgi:hypothetical protein